MLAPGTLLFHNQYCIVRHLRTGGQAIVYEGYDLPIGRTVAIKETFHNEEWAHEAFKREAHLLANLHHRAIPPVYNYFLEYGSAFVVMRFIPGDDLDTILKRGRNIFSTENVLGWADQLLDALQYLQGRGIVHRDINPRNLKLDERDQIVLLDFGIAKDSSSQTPTLGGSRRYAPLEQLKDEGTDTRSDLYSLGATIYHLLTAIPPPDAASREIAILKGHPDPLRPLRELKPQIAPNVADVLMRAMSLDRDNRPATVTLMRDELKEAVRTNCYPSTKEECESEEKARTTRYEVNNVSESTSSLSPVTTNDTNKITQRRIITINLPENNKSETYIDTPTSNSEGNANRRSSGRSLRAAYFKRLFPLIGRILGGKGRSIVGLDVGSSSLKAVELKFTDSGFELLHIAHRELRPGAILDGRIVDLNHVSNTIDRIWVDQNIKTRQVATSVSGPAVIVKKILLPVMSEKELDEQIHWEAEQYIPFDMSDVNLYHEIIAYDSMRVNMDVLIVACKRDKIAQVTQVISQAGKQPIIVNVDAFALQNTYEVNYCPTPDQTVALLNIGASIMTINIVRGSTSVFTRDILAGGNQYTDLLQRELSLTFEKAEALKRGTLVDENLSVGQAQLAIDSVSEMLALEIQRTLDFFHAIACDSTKIDRMLIAGGSSKILHLADSFSKLLQMPVELLDSFRLIKFDQEKFDSLLLQSLSPSFAIALGLATKVAEVTR